MCVPKSIADFIMAEARPLVSVYTAASGAAAARTKSCAIGRHGVRHGDVLRHATRGRAGRSAGRANQVHEAKLEKKNLVSPVSKT